MERECQTWAHKLTNVQAHNCRGVTYPYQRGIVKEVRLGKLRRKEFFQSIKKQNRKKSNRCFGCLTFSFLLGFLECSLSNRLSDLPQETKGYKLNEIKLIMWFSFFMVIVSPSDSHSILTLSYCFTKLGSCICLKFCYCTISWVKKICCVIQSSTFLKLLLNRFHEARTSP